MLNFGVSFVLALLVALRARQVERGDRLRLLRSIIVTFLRSPLQFFIPPRAPLEAPVHGPVTLPPPAAANR
jgi:site-specific recombinase